MLVATLTYHLPPDKYQQAVRFHDTLAALHFLEAAYLLLILTAMWRLGLAERIAGWARRHARRRVLQAPLILPPLLAIPGLALLPLDAWRHHLTLSNGLSVENWLPWFGDWLKYGSIELIIAVPAVWVGLALMRRNRRRWWLHAWLMAIPVTFLLALVFPLVIEPMFYNYVPLELLHPLLVPEIRNVAEHSGLPVKTDQVLEMNAGDKWKSLNAYMSGLGPTRRIVVWDTTIAALNVSQLQSVVAHELGHYALHHVAIGTSLGLLFLLPCLYLAGRFVERFTSEPGAWAALPLWLITALWLNFLSEPIANTYSRWQERQADIFELNVMKSLAPDAGRTSAEVDQIMGERSLDHPDPNPLVVFWIYTHPPTADRMRFAQTYLKTR